MCIAQQNRTLHCHFFHPLLGAGPLLTYLSSTSFPFCQSGTGSLCNAKPHTGQEAPRCSRLLAPGRGMLSPCSSPQPDHSTGALGHLYTTCRLAEAAAASSRRAQRGCGATLPTAPLTVQGCQANQHGRSGPTGALRCPRAALGIPGDWSSGRSLHSEISPVFTLSFLIAAGPQAAPGCSGAELPRGTQHGFRMGGGEKHGYNSQP